MTGWHYSIYGLQLHTLQPIPGLNPADENTAADVQVWFGQLPGERKALLDNPKGTPYVSYGVGPNGEPDWEFWESVGDDCCRLRFSDGADFVMQHDGSQLWVMWPENLTLEYVTPYLLGSVMGLMLRLGGVTALHGGAIAVGDQALALVGPSGAGKSTTLAMLALRGLAVLCDDVVALAEQDDGFWVQPAYPRLRLWSDSIPLLYESPVDLPRLATGWDKRYLNVTEGDLRFQEKALPLRVIYLLEERSSQPTAPFIEPVDAGPGLIELIGNAFGSHLLDKARRAQEFETLSQVVQLVALRRVTPSADPAKLPQLCDKILDDFRVLAGTTSPLEQPAQHV